MRRPALAALIVLLAACGGPSPGKLHDQHAGKPTAEIKAALGEPLYIENLPSNEGEPARERWFYQKSKALGGDDDGSAVAVEFEGGKETRIYAVDAQTFKNLNRDIGEE